MGAVAQGGQGTDAAMRDVALDAHDHARFWETTWLCEKWSEEAVDFCRAKLSDMGVDYIQDGVEVHGTGEEVWSNELQRPVEKLIVVPKIIPIKHGITSDILRKFVGAPEEIERVEGNLLVNEGIQLLIDVLIGASANTYNNANSYMGVGDTATAEAASQTELLATQNAANRFYKAQVASYPQRPGSNGAQSADWRSDFTSTEANFVWNEWTIARGATTASGSGFLVGTINLNRKVQSLGTKTTGTWTLTGTVTIS